MKSRSMKIVGILLTMLVLVATLGAFTLMASAADPTVTITFDNTSKRTVGTTSQQVWKENGITVTNNKASSSSNVNTSYYNPIRLYAGSSLTVEYPSMTKIAFTISQGASDFKTSIGTVSGATVSVSGTIVTVTFNTPVDSFSVAKMTKQVRLNSLTVTYINATAECTHPTTSAADNGNGTHKIVCTNPNCGEIIEASVSCSNKEAIDNGNGTHKIVCADCDGVLAAAENHDSNVMCSKCGWVDTSKIKDSTLTFNNANKRTETSTSKHIWQENGITFINTKTSDSNALVDNINPIRAYKNSIITIKCTGMTKIVFKCSGSDYTNALDGNATVSGTTVTVTFDTPVDEYTVTLSIGQVRLNSITVTSIVPECSHEETNCVNLGNGFHKVVCSECEEVVTAQEAHTSALTCDKCDYVLPFEFNGWSLTLYDNLSLNYTVDAVFFANGYTNPTATFVIGERTVVIAEYTEKDGKYVFTLSDIAPHQMGTKVQATLSATKDGETVSNTTERTIKEYCMQILTDASQDAKVKTLVVDLLNYGSASQTYVGATDALVNADLTDAQKALATGELTLSTVANSAHAKVENAKATWAGAYLLLVDTVEMNFVFNAESTEGLVVKIVTESGKTYTITEFTTYGEGAYVASFRAFGAAQMSEVVDVTVYEGENAVSNTYRYSIESYAFAKQNDADANLASLVGAMMKYGHSAKAYIA